MTTAFRATKANTSYQFPFTIQNNTMAWACSRFNNANTQIRPVTDSIKISHLRHFIFSTLRGMKPWCHYSGVIIFH